MARGKKTGGRQRGTPNKATVLKRKDLEALSAMLLDTEAYEQSLVQRIIEGRAPQIEMFLLQHRYGTPKSSLELTGKDGGPVEIADARDRLFTRLTALAAGKPSPDGD